MLTVRALHSTFQDAKTAKQPAADVDVIRLPKLSAVLLKQAGRWAAAHFPSHLHKLQPTLKARRKNKPSPVFGNTRTHNTSVV